MANRPESLLKFVKSNYAGCAKLTSEQFYDIFKKYDADGNDCIDAKELDLFLQDVQKADPNATNLDALKNEILEKYDANYDGVIQMSELAQCLPLEENFLVGFRKDNVISSVDFMKIFKKYDTDKSGYIEVPELKVFLMDLLDADKKAISPSRINDYASAMIEIFDRNKDGKLELSELSRLLQVEDNF
ncbi:predicted protein [Nematostella vectensis]|uniref:EF-hand domain-containing protein n=2 Tax=Nematostella vectensis TaxID=45351 RepID=A7RRJ5_NEMVE|nr:predicted protein [Nematostella vectensis]|eukprot:XP_001638028.1 predicted protein [Nematostella vectensis]